MKKAHLLPLVLFCFIFLAYSLYFVRVVNRNVTLEKDGIAKTIVRVMENQEEQPEEEAPAEGFTDRIGNLFNGSDAAEEGDTKPSLVRYVNFAFLNLREEASLGSPILEKLQRGDEVQIIAFTTPNWAHVRVPSGTEGYVARKYLAETTQEVEDNDPEKNIKQRIYNLPIVTYHHISDDATGYAKNLVLPTINFTRQLDYLIENDVKTLTFKDLKKVQDGETTLPEKAVMLTFNNGSSTHYITSQHLNGKGLKGVFFVDPDFIGTEGHLTWREVSKMKEWGMDIELSAEANLNSSSFEFLQALLSKSKATLEEQINDSVIAFAYPSGRYNATVIKVLESLGISFARTSKSGNLQLLHERPLELYTFTIFPPAGPRQFQAWGIGR